MRTHVTGCRFKAPTRKVPCHSLLADPVRDGGAFLKIEHSTLLQCNPLHHGRGSAIAEDIDLPQGRVEDKMCPAANFKVPLSKSCHSKNSVQISISVR